MDDKTSGQQGFLTKLRKTLTQEDAIEDMPEERRDATRRKGGSPKDDAVDLQARCATIMSKNVLTVDETTSIPEAARLMTEKKTTSLIALGDGKITGIVSERDFMTHIAAKGSKARALAIKDIMTPSLVTVSSDTSIAEVARLMREHNCRRIPVTTHGDLVGIVTQDDIIQALSGVWEHVESIMRTNVVAVEPDKSLMSVAKNMARRGVGQIVVTDRGRVVGMLTEKDFLTKVFAEGRDPGTLTVGDVMTAPVITVAPDFPIFKASELMRERGIRRLPVVKDGNLVGMLTQDDIANAMKSVVHQIQPVAEKSVGGQSKYALRQSYSYLVLEEAVGKSGDIFKDLVTHGVSGLAVTRTHPDKIRKQFDLEKTPIIWLSKERDYDPHIDPSDVVGLGYTIKEFIKKSDDGVVWVAGIEYLAVQNSYAETLKFLQSVNEAVAQSRARLIVSVDPKALGEQEVHLLEREVDEVESTV